jgi:hypothetical protein
MASLLGFRVEARKRSMALIPCWRRNAARLDDCIAQERPPYIGVRRGSSPLPRAGTHEEEAQPPRAGAQGLKPPVPNLPLYPKAAHLYT